jgi:hypothetical protein
VRYLFEQLDLLPDPVLRHAKSDGPAYSDRFLFTSSADYPDELAHYHVALTCLRCCNAESNDKKKGPFVSLTDVTYPMVVKPHKFQEQYNAIYWSWWERIAPCLGDLMQQYVDVEFARPEYKTDDDATDSMMNEEADIITSVDDNMQFCNSKVPLFGPHLLTLFDQVRSLLLCTGINPSCKS